MPGGYWPVADLDRRGCDPSRPMSSSMDTRRREHLSLWRPVGTVMLPDETLLVRPHTTDAGRRELHDREAAHDYAAACADAVPSWAESSCLTQPSAMPSFWTQPGATASFAGGGESAAFGPDAVMLGRRDWRHRARTGTLHAHAFAGRSGRTDAVGLTYSPHSRRTGHLCSSMCRSRLVVIHIDTNCARNLKKRRFGAGSELAIGT